MWPSSMPDPVLGSAMRGYCAVPASLAVGADNGGAGWGVAVGACGGRGVDTIVAVGVGVPVGIRLRWVIGVAVAGEVLVGVAVAVGVGVWVAVGVAVAVLVGVGVAVAVSVGVGVGVAVAVSVGVGVAVAVSVGVGVAVSVGVGVAVSVGVDVGDPVTTTTFPAAADSIASGSATTLVSRRENTSAEVRRNSVAVRPLYGMEILSLLSDAPYQVDSVAGATGNGQSGACPICHPRPTAFGLRQALRLE